MKKRRLKIFGERNTGTNYLDKLVRSNLNVDLLRGVVPRPVHKYFLGTELPKDVYFALTFPRNLGWKHALVPSPDQIRNMGVYSNDLVFLTLTKNPYSWLLSLYRRPYHVRGKTASFETFLTARWKPVRRERLNGTWPNPIELWNLKNGSYLRLRSSVACENLRYEDLLSDPETTISHIASGQRIGWVGEGFHNVVESTKEKGKDFSYYVDYYLNEDWRAKLTAESIAIINGSLDWRVVEAFGYSRIA